MAAKVGLELKGAKSVSVLYPSQILPSISHVKNFCLHSGKFSSTELIWLEHLHRSSYNQSMQDFEIQALVGESIAKGLTDGEILDALTKADLTEEEAATVLRGVYNQWSEIKSSLDLGDEDNSNWHQFIRKKLLQKALANDIPSSQHLALRILDSLAQIQGIGVVPLQPVPLYIELVEKVEPDATQEA